MTATHYTDTLEQVRRMVDALQAARDCITTDRQALADCSAVPELTPGDDPDNFVQIGGRLFDLDTAGAIQTYDLVLEHIDAALAPVTGSPAPLCELVRWRLATDAERPDADITVHLCLESAESGRSVECGWWDGEQWCLCESGGAAVQADVRAWAEVWGPAL